MFVCHVRKGRVQGQVGLYQGQLGRQMGGQLEQVQGLRSVDPAASLGQGPGKLRNLDRMADKAGRQLGSSSGSLRVAENDSDA
jgi:hypothetical protein